ncbi:methyltransferase domain-containing protein [Zooshikella harenae]|uniref:Methyltransferase domain-containing protein n=1 Tax=Zooshikella harenae TaxID=2827238 RepID=A0ABS5ZCA7_9GAMM|nr:methyltransferase domain-containing protein [Zooshikella harenae]MBU2711610.1 methyltransferase domain-containing protein [Zooshikella harenae]
MKLWRNVRQRPSYSAILPVLHQWLQTGVGKRFLASGHQLLDHTLDTVFGYHGVVVSICETPSILQASRVAHHTLITPFTLPEWGEQQVIASPSSWPLRPRSVDMVLLHHGLDYVERPHRLLREACKVVIPGGKIIIIGFNPWSLWGASRRIREGYKRGGKYANFIAVRRLQDWLTLLNFSVDHLQYAGFTLPIAQGRIAEPAWEKRCERWHLPFGSLYLLKATRELAGMTPIRPVWRQLRESLATPTLVEPNTRRKI